MVFGYNNVEFEGAGCVFKPIHKRLKSKGLSWAIRILLCLAKPLLRFDTRRAILAMSNETKEPMSATELLKNSSLYREFQAEREEILKHKWIESEKAGRDIGFERALTDWIIKHRSKWRKSRQAAAQ